MHERGNRARSWPHDKNEEEQEHDVEDQDFIPQVFTIARPRLGRESKCRREDGIESDGLDSISFDADEIGEGSDLLYYSTPAFGVGKEAEVYCSWADERIGSVGRFGVSATDDERLLPANIAQRYYIETPKTGKRT